MKSYAGAKPQSRRAAAVVHVLGPRVDDALALLVHRVGDARRRKRAQDFRANLVGRRRERAEVVGRLRERASRGARGEREQRLDAVGHRHERNARVGPDEAGVRLPLRGRVDHLGRVVRRAARRHGHRRNQARKPHGAEIHAAALRVGRQLLVVTARSSGRAARNTACCTRTSSSAASTRPRGRGRRGASPRATAGRTRRSTTDRETTTGRPCDSASRCANSSRFSVPSTLTSCAVTRRELGARREQRGQVEDQVDLELREDPLERARGRGSSRSPRAAPAGRAPARAGRRPA